ncbi:hypothetical protein I4U23_022619 [Adineta vaga]|nr:hypothetical protein I4U23_022619 [Adineta vaga]
MEKVCANVTWLRIYTLITAVVVPSVMNIIFNILIFRYVRSSSCRVQSHNNQMMNLGRREISLLRQMIFMFITFIGGWSGTYISVIISQFITINEWITPVMIIFSALCILGITINLFISNHEVKRYVVDKVCVYVTWLRFYTLITAVVVPSIMNIIFNVLIFRYVRSSSCRVQPHNNQMMNLGRREISLLRQMIFMFITFMGGWSTSYVIVIVSQFMSLNEWIRPAMVVFSELCIVGIILNLFISNHELKNYVFDKIHRVFRH